MSFCYNVLLFLWVICNAPRILWQKKYRETLFAKLGLQLKNIPQPQHPKVLWVHAVSLGEMKASQPLLQRFRSDCPNTEIYFSTTTKTAYSQAAKTLAGVIDHLFYLPLDFSPIMRRYVTKLRPDMLVLIETDVWQGLIREVKKRGGKVFIASGKISSKSWQRLKKWPWISHWLFGNIDLICCQSDTYQERFLDLRIPQERLCVTGNLKYDAMPAPKFLLNSTTPSRIFITLASTHEGEESALLTALLALPSSIAFFLAPRHPERFASVEEWLKQQQIPFEKFTQMKSGLDGTTARVVLINTIGELDKCYALSPIVIVGGSFVPGIGGHNIYEPIRFHKSVLFGPYMHNQEELVKDVLVHNAARQTDLKEIKNAVEALLQNPINKGLLEDFESHVKGASLRTFEKIQLFLARKHSP